MLLTFWAILTWGCCGSNRIWVNFMWRKMLFPAKNIDFFHSKKPNNIPAKTTKIALLSNWWQLSHCCDLGGNFWNLFGLKIILVCGCDQDLFGCDRDIFKWDFISHLKGYINKIIFKRLKWEILLSAQYWKVISPSLNNIILFLYHYYWKYRSI